jgi:hypothetical protein
MTAPDRQAGIQKANVAATIFQDDVRYVLLSRCNRFSEEWQRQRNAISTASGPQLGTVAGTQQEIDGELFGHSSHIVAPCCFSLSNGQIDGKP